MAFPADPLDVDVDLLIDGVWVEITDDVEIGESDLLDLRLGGRDESSGVDPASFTFKLNLGASRVAATLGQFGVYSPYNVEGPYYGKVGRNTGVRVRVGGYVRLIGDIPSLPPRWSVVHDSAGRPTVVWVTVAATGALRRLQRGEPLRDTPTRYIPTTGPVAYWSLTEGLLSDTGAAAVVGTEPLRPYTGAHPSGTVFGPPNWGAGRLAPWLEPVVSRPGRGPVTALWAPVSMPAFSNTWCIDQAYASSAEGTDSSLVVDVNPQYLGGSANWPQLSLWPGTREVRVTMAGLSAVSATVPGLFDGLVHHLRWRCTQTGATVTWSVEVDGATVSFAFPTMTLEPVRVIALLAGGDDAVAYAQGHVAIWLTPPDVTEAVSATFGWRGEAAGRRIERICEEEGVPLGVVGDLDATEAVGPQYTGATLVDVCEEAAAADRGILHEPREIIRVIGDFEDGTTQDWVGAGTPTPAVANSTTRAYAGTRSLRITWGTAGTLPLVQLLSPQRFVPGVTYTVSARVWIPTGSVDVLWALAGIGFGAASTLRDQWQLITMSFVATATDHITQIWPATPATSGNQAWVDDVRITTDERGLAYRTRESLYNQAPALELDYAQGHLAPPFEPEPDDRLAANLVTVSRRDGGSATVEVTDGPMSTARPPGGIGRYPKQLTLNLSTDDQLRPRAGLEAHLGAQEAPRYPQVTVDLSDNPDLLDAVAAVRIGDLITIANLPDFLPRGLVKLIARGYSEQFNDVEWRITWDCVPGEPWDVGVLDDTVLGRLDTGDETGSGGSELASAITTSAATFEVAVTAGPMWSVDDAEFPFDVKPAGELMTVTDIAPALITFGSAGAAATAVDTSLTPALPGGLASGELMLMPVAARSTSIGPIPPAGWVTLVDLGNLALLGRIAGASETAPTVTFSGSLAGDDRAAQIARFTGRWSNLFNATPERPGLLVSGVAQDIALPTLRVTADNSLVIRVGWKGDDSTSVTSPGTEIGEIQCTAGNDQLLVWSYEIQTTATSISASQFTVTGGTTAVSRSAAIALRCDKQLWTVTRSVNGVVKSHPAGTDVRLANPLILAL